VGDRTAGRTFRLLLLFSGIRCLKIQPAWLSLTRAALRQNDVAVEPLRTHVADPARNLPRVGQESDAFFSGPASSLDLNFQDLLLFLDAKLSPAGSFDLME
jgi:hypothetical protein